MGGAVIEDDRAENPATPAQEGDPSVCTAKTGSSLAVGPQAGAPLLAARLEDGPARVLALRPFAVGARKLDDSGRERLAAHLHPHALVLRVQPFVVAHGQVIIRHEVGPNRILDVLPELSHRVIAENPLALQLRGLLRLGQLVIPVPLHQRLIGKVFAELGGHDPLGTDGLVVGLAGELPRERDVDVAGQPSVPLVAGLRDVVGGADNQRVGRVVEHALVLALHAYRVMRND